MNNIRIVSNHEIWATVRRRSFIVMTAIFPALALLALAGFAIYQQVSDGDTAPTEAVVVGYVDESGLFADEWEQGATTYRPIEGREQAFQALLNEEIDDLVLIPEDYLATGQVVRVQEETQGVGVGGGSAPALEQFLLDNLLADRLSDDVRARVDLPSLVQTLEIDADGNPVQSDFDGGRLLFFLLLTFLVMFGVFTASGYFQEGLSEEKETRIMEVLLSSITPRDLMFGKLLGLGLVGLAQTVFWVVFAVGLFLIVRATGLVDLPDEIMEMPLPGPGLMLLGLLYYVLGYILLGALMSALGAVTTSHREAQQVVFLFLLPFLIPVWFVGAIIGDPGGAVARWLSLVPLTSPTGALVRLGVDGMSGMEILISLALLTVTTALAVLFALRLFEAYLLMYGQRPGLLSLGRTMIKGA
ncbi:MAG: ABC transporter permease [Dehalococcoidia bacterium]